MVGIKGESTVDAVNTISYERVTVVMCLEGDIGTCPDVIILDVGAGMTEVRVIEIELDAVFMLLMLDTLKVVIGSA